MPQTTQDLNLKEFCGTKWGWRSVGKCFKTLHPTCNQFLSHHRAPVYFKARPVALTARGEEKWHDLDRWALPGRDSVNGPIFCGSYLFFSCFFLPKFVSTKLLSRKEKGEIATIRSVATLNHTILIRDDKGQGLGLAKEGYCRGWM